MAGGGVVQPVILAGCCAPLILLFIVCWALFIINYLQNINRTIEALLFPKKLVFRVGKIALTKTYLLTSFGRVMGFLSDWIFWTKLTPLNQS